MWQLEPEHKTEQAQYLTAFYPQMHCQEHPKPVPQQRGFGAQHQDGITEGIYEVHTCSSQSTSSSHSSTLKSLSLWSRNVPSTTIFNTSLTTAARATTSPEWPTQTSPISLLVLWRSISWFAVCASFMRVSSCHRCKLLENVSLSGMYVGSIGVTIVPTGT